MFFFSRKKQKKRRSLFTFLLYIIVQICTELIHNLFHSHSVHIALSKRHPNMQKTFTFVIFMAIICATSGSMAGGFGNVVPATDIEQKLLDHVRNAVEEKVEEKFPQFQAVSFTTQVVAGTNYIIVVDTGKEVLHVKLHKPLPFRGDKPILMKVVRGKTLDSPVAPGEFV